MPPTQNLPMHPAYYNLDAYLLSLWQAKRDLNKAFNEIFTWFNNDLEDLDFEEEKQCRIKKKSLN